jgi:hypothetical protein
VERPANNVNISAKIRVPIVNSILITALLENLSNQQKFPLSVIEIDDLFSIKSHCLF